MRNKTLPVRLEVFVNGFIVGAVAGKNRLDAYAKARKYFPDVTSVGNNHSGFVNHPFFVWVSPNFALANYDRGQG